MFVTKLVVFCVNIFEKNVLAAEEKMMEILQQIDRLKAELDALRPLDAEHEVRVMQKFRLDWNFHSNHLEGNSLSYGETKALILFGITAQGKPLKDHLEMTGHNEAIKWIEEVVHEERPLTENFIRQLHKLLLKEPYQVDAVTPDGQPTKKWVKVGEYKTTPNNVITVTGEPFFFASPEETPAKMHDLIEWYRAKKEEAKFHPLLLAAEFHYKFVRIHPFDDGNGRTARILMNFILMKNGLPPVIIKTQDKQSYFAALRQADAGLLEPFIEYIGANLVHSLELMLKGAKGEDVEEFEDLAKKVKLLKQKVKSRKSTPREIYEKFKEESSSSRQNSASSNKLLKELKSELDLEKSIKEELEILDKKVQHIQNLIARIRIIFFNIKNRNPNKGNVDISELATKAELEELIELALELKNKELLELLGVEKSDFNN